MFVISQTSRSFNGINLDFYEALSCSDFPNGKPETVSSIRQLKTHKTGSWMDKLCHFPVLVFVLEHRLRHLLAQQTVVLFGISERKRIHTSIIVCCRYAPKTADY